jgi:hypothetical protein
MALMVTVLEATVEPLTVDATLKEKFDVGLVTVRPIFTVSPAAILHALSRVMTSGLAGRDATPPPDCRQLAATASTSETLVGATTVEPVTLLLSLSVTVIVSPLGIALGAVIVIT